MKKLRLTKGDIIIKEDCEPLYEMSRKGFLSVCLFVANTINTTSEKKIKIQGTEELNDIGWFKFDEALKKLDGVKNRKELLQEVIDKIVNNN